MHKTGARSLLRGVSSLPIATGVQLCAPIAGAVAALGSGGNLTIKGFASTADEKIVVKCSPFRPHRLEPPSQEVETSGSELWEMLKTMTRMRRMELSADMLYKSKLARGFLHLADGQEAIPCGMEAALTFQDSMIQSYRTHLTYMGRGGTVKEVAAELMGRYTGAAKGIGGSMHLYKKENNFYGGAGIVGEQVPVGAGLAFAHQYRNDGSASFTLYGDGAANQGQIFEAFNIAALWNLPAVFVIENNHYGMGTAEARAAKSPRYYTRGDYVPGMWVDGMDVLAVKQATAFAKQHALEQGPLCLEMDTYRYHGTPSARKFVAVPLPLTPICTQHIVLHPIPLHLVISPPMCPLASPLATNESGHRPIDASILSSLPLLLSDSTPTTFILCAASSVLVLVAGHSISDPGSTYRTRDEIQGMRQTRDPIEHVKTLLKEHKFADATEIKRVEKEIRKEVNDEIEQAKKDDYPPTEFLWKNTYKDGLGAKMRPLEMGQPKIPV
eukprot:CAMPEP_0206149976 /NCGR_PEP_ID=MMETSP1473-20131121/38059_1 /ASSEMBLY_ACC=CAM_ASM_001109 /TAXON_ID=1461547 /ORGANISM="Stichococcus sp, Strain RCC1054" /LENGTH=497 /DNA_ID=CAMNT_0053547463 /DNA_START=1600 /DNA_END=3094 /DNA_ORIENTATION=-